MRAIFTPPVPRAERLRVAPTIDDDRAVRRPATTDFMCARRTLRLLDARTLAALDGAGEAPLGATEAGADGAATGAAEREEVRKREYMRACSMWSMESGRVPVTRIPFGLYNHKYHQHWYACGGGYATLATAATATFHGGGNAMWCSTCCLV